MLAKAEERRAPRKELLKVACGAPRLRKKSTEEGTKVGFVRSTEAGGRNEHHQKKKPAPSPLLLLLFFESASILLKSSKR